MLKVIKSFFVFIALVFTCLIVGAQKPAESEAPFALSGKVIDQDTKEPLAFATVGIREKSLGVVSNKLGEFEFSIPEKYLGDTLWVSMLGYHEYLQPLNDVRDQQTIVIQLKNKPVVLQEIVVSTKQLTAKEIVEKAIEHIKFNYPQTSYMMEGFFRQYIKENGKYVGLYEAACQLFDRRYSIPVNKHDQREKVYLMEARKGKTVDFLASLYYEEWNFFHVMLIENDVRYGKNALDPSRYEYSFKEYTFLDDRLVYVIKADGNEKENLYIDAENYAILKIEGEWHQQDSASWVPNDTLLYRAKSLKKTILFKEVAGVYFPHYMRYTTVFDAHSSVTKEKLFTTESYNELMVNDMHLGKMPKPDKKLFMIPHSSLQFIDKPYNPEFWAHYNTVKETPLDKKILDDLESEMSLETQFQSNSKEPEAEKMTIRKKRRSLKRNGAL